jgi:hypothetical protein
MTRCEFLALILILNYGWTRYGKIVAKIPSKMQHFSGFVIRVRSEVGLQAKFCSEMIVTVITHQILLRNEENICVSVPFSVSSISNCQIFER